MTIAQRFNVGKTVIQDVEVPPGTKGVLSINRACVTRCSSYHAQPAMRLSSYPARLTWFSFLALLLSAIASSAQVTTAPKQGIRENDPRLHALTNARIVTAPGKIIEKGTVLIRDGVIVEAGPEVKIPTDARVWDLAGKTIYPGSVSYTH